MEPTAQKKLPIEAGFILLAGLLCLAFQLRLPALLPSQSDYEQVQKVLEAEVQPGDALLLYPWWAERVRLFAPDRLQVVGFQGSDSEALELNPRIWVLSEPDLPKSDLSKFLAAFLPGRTAIGAERTFGRLHLALYQNGRARKATFSLADSVGSAQVYLEGPGGERQPCSWDGRAHRCPGGAAVATEWHDVRYQPRRCVKLSPPGGATKLVIELPSVPAADVLAVQSGVIWERAFYDGPGWTPISVGAELNGTRALSLEFPPRRSQLVREEGPAVQQGSSLRLWSQSGKPEGRELCVEAWGFLK